MMVGWDSEPQCWSSLEKKFFCSSLFLCKVTTAVPLLSSFQICTSSVSTLHLQHSSRLLQPSRWPTSSRSLRSKGKRAVESRITMVTPTSSQSWKVVSSTGLREAQPCSSFFSSFPTNAMGEMLLGCQWVACIWKVIMYLFILESSLEKWMLFFFSFSSEYLPVDGVRNFSSHSGTKWCWHLKKSNVLWQ